MRNLEPKRQLKGPNKNAAQRAFQRLSWALQTILTYRNQTEIDFALQVAKMFAALEFDPKTGHYSNDSLGVPRESKKRGTFSSEHSPQQVRG